MTKVPKLSKMEVLVARLSKKPHQDQIESKEADVEKKVDSLDQRMLYLETMIKLFREGQKGAS